MNTRRMVSCEGIPLASSRYFAGILDVAEVVDDTGREFMKIQGRPAPAAPPSIFMCACPDIAP